jgi:hypothetical protein
MSAWSEIVKKKTAMAEEAAAAAAAAPAAATGGESKKDGKKAAVSEDLPSYARASGAATAAPAAPALAKSTPAAAPASGSYQPSIRFRACAQPLRGGSGRCVARRRIDAFPGCPSTDPRRSPSPKYRLGMPSRPTERPASAV